MLEAYQKKSIQKPDAIGTLNYFKKNVHKINVI